MAAGLARQLGFCTGGQESASADTAPAPQPTPDWCADADFVQALRDAQTRLWTSIRGAKDRTSPFSGRCRTLQLTQSLDRTVLGGLVVQLRQHDERVQRGGPRGALALGHRVGRDPAVVVRLPRDCGSQREWHTGDVSPRSPLNSS